MMGQRTSTGSGWQSALTAGVSPVGAGRLNQLTYARLRTLLLSGGLPPGTVLTEGPLAEQLGVSKTPVRHALRALHQEGLLISGPRRRLQVRGFSAQERHELDEIRGALERLTLGHACREMSPDDLDHLHTLLRRQRRAVEARRLDDFIRLDEEFHLALAQYSGLSFAPDLLLRVRGLVSLIQVSAGRVDGDLGPALREHVAIVEALEARDKDAAVTAMTRHLRLVEARVEATTPAHC